MKQILLRHDHTGQCLSFRQYCSEGGFEALRKALQDMSPNDVQQTVIDSGLRGRGGAGFPTGKKWSFVPRNLPGPRYLICNCDEMEPGTYKDRVLLEHNPYLLIEGMTLACYALGVEHAFIFVRRGYEQAADNLRHGHRRSPAGRFSRRKHPRKRFQPGTGHAPVGRALYLR